MKTFLYVLAYLVLTPILYLGIVYLISPEARPQILEMILKKSDQDEFHHDS